jgi:hypothetical protein
MAAGEETVDAVCAVHEEASQTRNDCVARAVAGMTVRLPLGASAAGRAKHSWIVTQRIEGKHNDLGEAGMRWIEQPVVFMRGESRGDDQNTALGLADEVVSDAGEFR